ISHTQVDRAGVFLRDWWRAESDSDEEAAYDRDELSDAALVLSDYRTGFQEPLKKVTVGLRQFVARESGEIVVGQRLKR
ncbi:hypothetical protein, partial [Streptomyces naphthomycinicus]|uniref:hypothetical protein n=1 Tax=Streptomyces naphthomycinicus TaxID=2872625 RepID=UPI00288A9840